MNTELKNLLENIKGLSEESIELAIARQAKLAKPPGSLGKLEEISIRLSGISGRVCNEMNHCRVVAMCADNGVCIEGVSSAPVSVTASQMINMTAYKTGMSSMAHHFGDEVRSVDVGVATPYNCDKVTKACVRKGTGNIRLEPAMEEAELYAAIMAGIDEAKKAAEDGITAIGIGEMGIGNTTTSSAVLCALTGLSVETVTGRGGGLTDDAFAVKKQVISDALARMNSKTDFSKLSPEDGVLKVMEEVGGLDIAAMCGLYLGSALYRIPTVIDGFISVVAALCAARLCPEVKNFMFPSHKSFEIGYNVAIKELSLAPYLNMDMRLGEGSGCVLAFRVLEAACASMNDMALFGEESDINDEYLDEIRQGDKFKV